MNLSSPDTTLPGPDPKGKGPGGRNVQVSGNQGTATLSGPDVYPGSRPPVRGANNSGGTLSGPDVNNTNTAPVENFTKNTGGFSPGSRPSPGLGGSGSGGAFVSPDNIDYKINWGAGSSPGDPRRLGPGSGGALVNPDPSPAVLRITTDPDFYFRGWISEEVLHNYLDRVLIVQNLSLYSGPGPTYPSSSSYAYYDYRTDYAPYPAPGNPLYDLDYEHGSLLDMIVKTKAKFVWDIAFWWGGPGNDTALTNVCNTIRYDAEYIHYYDSDVILGAGLSEWVNSSGSSLLSVPPPEVCKLFYGTDGRPAGFGSHFRYDLMLPNWLDCITGHENKCIPDIRNAETQLWYYYLATRFIDAGCEALIFGAFDQVCKNDTGFCHLWHLTKAIRDYAALYNPAKGRTNARRGAVIMNNSLNIPLGQGYFDPGTTPLPPLERQLIFDFVDTGTLYDRCCDALCRNADLGLANYPVELRYTPDGVLNNTIGGIHPQGWLCSHSPGLSILDNGGIAEGSGCTYLDATSYGFDNTSWFVWQREYLRQLILRYSYYMVKCLDPYSHFSMPGRLIYYKTHGGADQHYCAFSETETIKEIWNGTYASPIGWEHHNFTNENVIDGGFNANSSMVFVGSDKIFFIGTDNYISGYIYIDGTYNDGVWHNWGPSYSAYVNFGQSYGSPGDVQVKAKSDLVASPDGTTLLYIGVDGYIHGFNILTVWEYYYFDFQKDLMIDNGIKAHGSLIYPDANMIFFVAQVHDLYVAGYSTGITQYLQCLFKDALGWWLNVPLAAAYAIYGTPWLDQFTPEKGLTYDAATSRVYYVTTNGYLAWYEVRGMNDFFYVACPGNFHMHDHHLTIVGNLALYRNLIYFVCLADDGTNFIQCMVDDGSPSWSSFSPSFMATNVPISAQVRSDPNGLIAISPDGSMIAYFGAFPAPFVYYFLTLDGVHYSFNSTVIAGYAAGDNSLQFTSNTDIFYINFAHANVHRLKIQEAYCENDIFNHYPQ